MKEIKVLGVGCARCKAAQKLIEEVAKQQGADVHVEKVEDLREIMAFRVLSTPGVVVDGKLVHVGSVPSRALITNWLH